MITGDRVRTLVPRSGIPVGSTGLIIDVNERDHRYKFIDDEENDYQAWFNKKELELV